MKIVCILFMVGVLCLKTSTANSIQIVAPVDHRFQLKADVLKPILDKENIKDRNVVVISIAGAFRQGKSFLMNFFIKYLYAQYESHNITDWIGEHTGDSGLDGFKWRAGRKRETLGIWIWSEIFTHDYENGEKVAIILLDTQGVFDDQSSVRDCTTIFSLSMMLSSVQCYNLMQNMKEDDLQHLELFTEYGRLALEQSNVKPFQTLLFIVRDWPFAFETNYGWNGQKIVDETLAENDGQTSEMRQLRTRIKSSFENITAFLMPHPGMIVANGHEFTGDIQQIDAKFRKYVKDLVPSLIAPENLIPKKISGQKVRARDFLQYLQAYIAIFNGDALPEPKSIFMATAETSNLILFNDCVNSYDDLMQKYLANVETHLKEMELVQTHQKTKCEVVAKFLEKPKLCGAELTATFQRRIEETVEEKFNAFKAENERKRNAFIEKANLYNTQLVNEMFEQVKRRVLEETDHPLPDAVNLHLQNIFIAERQSALDEFNSKKMGEDEISNAFRGKLEQDLNNFQITLCQVLDSINQWSNHYSHRMQESLNGVGYRSPDDLMGLHQTVRDEVVSQFRSQAGDNELKFKLQSMMDRSIGEKLPHFELQNEAKHTIIVTNTVDTWRWPKATASCPSGKTATGGGGQCISLGAPGVGWTFIVNSFPSSETEWEVQCDTPEQQNVRAVAYVVCH